MWIDAVSSIFLKFLYIVQIMVFFPLRRQNRASCAWPGSRVHHITLSLPWYHMIFFELEHFGRKKHLRPGHQRRRFRSTRIIKTMSGKPGNESFFGLGSTCWMIWFDEGWEPCSCVLDYSVASSPLDQCPKHALQTQLEIIYVCLLSGSYDLYRILCSHLFSPPSGLGIYSFWSRRRDLEFCLC